MVLRSSLILAVVGQCTRRSCQAGRSCQTGDPPEIWTMSQTLEKVAMELRMRAITKQLLKQVFDKKSLKDSSGG
jgi:hypothetical protein